MRQMVRNYLAGQISNSEVIATTLNILELGALSRKRLPLTTIHCMLGNLYYNHDLGYKKFCEYFLHFSKVYDVDLSLADIDSPIRIPNKYAKRSKVKKRKVTKPTPVAHTCSVIKDMKITSCF